MQEGLCKDRQRSSVTNVCLQQKEQELCGQAFAPRGCAPSRIRPNKQPLTVPRPMVQTTASSNPEPVGQLQSATGCTLLVVPTQRAKNRFTVHCSMTPPGDAPARIESSVVQLRLTISTAISVALPKILE